MTTSPDQNAPPPLPSPDGELVADAKRTLRRFKRIARVIAIALGALVLLVSLTWLVLDIWGAARLRAAENKAASLGVGLSNPSEVNITALPTLYKRAADMADTPPFRAALGGLPDIWMPSADHPFYVFTEDTMIRCSQLRNKQEPFFSTIDEFTTVSADGASGIALNRRYSSDITKALIYASWADADDDNGAAALRRLYAIMAIVQSRDTDYDTGSLFARCRFIDAALPDGLTNILWRTSFSNDALEDLQKRLAAAESAFSARPYLTGRLSDALGRYDFILARRAEDNRTGGLLGDFVALVIRGYAKADKARLISQTVDLIATADEQPPEVLRTVGTRERSDAPRRRSLFDPHDTARNVAEGYVRAGLTRARLRAARAAVAALRFKNDWGRFPESLDALVGRYIDAVPTDPFSGKPLLYLVDAGGIAVYSVAINGVDDKGCPETVLLSPNSGGRYDEFGMRVGSTDDVGFRIWLPDDKQSFDPTAEQ